MTKEECEQWVAVHVPRVQNRLCKAWRRKGVCKIGPSCEFRHTFLSAEEEEEVEATRAEVAAKAKAKAMHNLARKSESDKLFCDWLVDTFGQDMLQSGTGVIDVAGGRGMISFELWIRRGIPSTVVDPRSVSGFPRRLRKVFNKSGKEMFEHRKMYFTVETALADPTCADASVIVAMHPDQATDAAIEVALALGKPFAVVPCCVFAKLFPHRSLPPLHTDDDDDAPGTASSRPVKTYDDLIQYLQSLDPSIQSTTLPFDGRNIVLYHMGRGATTEEE